MKNNLTNFKIMHYKNCWDNKGTETTLKEFLNKVQTGFVKKECEYLRSETDGDKRQDYKKNNLPAAIVQGTFTKRNKESFIESSGLLILDIDHIEGEDIRGPIQKNKHVVFAFISPSGGLKFAVKIPKVKNDDQYKTCYAAAEQMFSNVDPDPMNKDITRLCFYSYDPEVYYNPNAEELIINIDEVAETTTKEENKKETSKAITNTLKGEVSPGERNSSLFKTACSFKSKGIDQNTTLQTLFTLNEKFENPLDNAEVGRIVTSAYSYKFVIDFQQERKKIIGEARDEVMSYLYPLQIKGQLKVKPDRATASEIICKVFNNFYPCASIRQDAKEELWVYSDGIYSPEGMTYVKELCEEILRRQYTTGLYNIVVQKILVKNYESQEDFFKTDNKNEIAVLNGILNIKTLELQPFTPKKKFFQKLNAKFDKKATCEKIKKTLRDLVSTDDDFKILQEFMGYTLYKDYPLEKILMLLGSGRNGKSLILALTKNFLGPKNCSSINLQRLCDTTSFDIQALHNKLANIGGDIPPNMLKETSSIKELTGNDMISAKRKFMTDINFVNYAKLIFSANALPSSNDDSKGFWDRWILIKLPYTFVYPEMYNSTKESEREFLKIRDNDLIDKLTIPEELSGLLNWSLEGLNNLLKREHFEFNSSTQNVKNKWLRQANSFSAFCEDVIESNYNSKITKKDLRMAYTSYCNKHEINIKSDIDIKNYLTTNLAAISKRINNQKMDEMCWVNIQFKGKFTHFKDFNTISPYRKKNTFSPIESKPLEVLEECEELNKKKPITYKEAQKNHKLTENIYELRKSDYEAILNHIEKDPVVNFVWINKYYSRELIDKMLSDGTIILKIPGIAYALGV